MLQCCSVARRCREPRGLPNIAAAHGERSGDLEFSEPALSAERMQRTRLGCNGHVETPPDNGGPTLPPRPEEGITRASLPGCVNGLVPAACADSSEVHRFDLEPRRVALSRRRGLSCELTRPASHGSKRDRIQPEPHRPVRTGGDRVAPACESYSFHSCPRTAKRADLPRQCNSSRAAPRALATR